MPKSGYDRVNLESSVILPELMMLAPSIWNQQPDLVHNHLIIVNYSSIFLVTPTLTKA